MSPHLRMVEAPSMAMTTGLLDGAAVLPRHGTESLTGVAIQDLEKHRAAYGERRSCVGEAGEQLLDAIDQVHLTGRGGGHFPTAAKWRSILVHGTGATVVANGAEGEPAAAKDAVLLQTRPHLVLDGLVAAMETVGSTDGVVWLHDGAWASARSISRALEERADAGVADPPIRVVLAPDRYLSGEATGIIRTLEGGPTLPRYIDDPSRPWSEGSRPVLVNNVETMARVGLLATGGVSTYEPTSLLTVVSKIHRVVVEVGHGTTFGEVVERAWSSPDRRAPQAVLLGGYGGSWVAWDSLRDLHVDPDELRRAGLSVGAGLIGPLPATACGLEEAARLMRYMSSQSARQCGPCVFGLSSVSELADDLSAGRLGPAGRRKLGRFMAEISGRGACRHPDGALRMLASALVVFGDDVRRHRRGRTCNAPTFAILPVPGED
jgi:NADH:ubiquinone oxidoreductase subunit F (NADH-binding)